jgi:hypothetical protein
LDIHLNKMINKFIIKKEKYPAPKYIYNIYRYNGKSKEWFANALELRQARQIIKNYSKNLN